MSEIMKLVIPAICIVVILVAFSCGYQEGFRDGLRATRRTG